MSEQSSNKRSMDGRSSCRKQKYRPEWEQDDLFKSWLSKDKNDKAFCKACGSSFMPRKASILQHLKTETHAAHMKNFSSTSSIGKCLNIPVENSVKTAELKICAALLEHNIPFKFMDHLSEVISNSFPDSEIAKNFSCKRTKAMALTNKVLSVQMKEKMMQDIKGTNGDIAKVKYSIIVDESTDISVKSNMAIVIKYHSEVTETIKTKLLNLVEVKDKTAEGLFGALKTEINNHGLQIQNLIGFAADTTNVMFGEFNSIVQKIKKDSPDCLFIKCVCHSIALAVSKASSALPRDVEDLIRDTYNYFSYSSKRREEFKDFQDFTNTPMHNTLKLYDVRWLSLGGCVERILEQWNALVLYFTEQHLSERLVAAERLHDMYMNPYKKLYLFFLSHVLKITNKLSLLFQAQYSVMSNFYKTISEAYKTLCSMYLKTGYLKATEAEDIDPESTVNFLPLKDIYIGVQGASFLLSNETLQKDKKIMDFFKVCQVFLIALCKELKTRLPFNNNVLKLMRFLDPSTAVTGVFPSLLPILSQFPHHFTTKDNEVIDAEWRSMVLCEAVSKIHEENPAITVGQFWSKISLLKEGDNFSFRNLSKFAFIILSLPISNSDCERIFSNVTLIKTKNRNRLTTASVANIIVAKEGLEGNCVNFSPDTKMLNAFNSDMYS